MRTWLGGAATMLALASSGVARAEWQEASSANFIVYSDDAPDKVKAFATELERFDKGMRVMRNVPDQIVSANQRVTVFVLRNTAQIEKLVGGRDIAGFYIPRVSGSVAFVPRRSGGGAEDDLSAMAVLLHEYAHHFMYANFGNKAYPAWFVEGFAEFNATARLRDGKLFFGAPPLYRAYGMTDTQAVPARDLLTKSPQQAKLSPEQTQTFYGRSWLLVHYLTFGEGQQGLLTKYLAAVNSGKSPAEAAAVLGDPRKLDSALTDYAMKRRLSATTIDVATLTIKPVTVRTLSPAEAAILPVRIRSSRGVDRAEAATVVALARKAAMPWPNDPAVQVALAEAEYDAGEYAAADAAAARALVADPTSVGAMMYRGKAQTELAVKKTVSDPKTWSGIRKWFSQANARDPENPWPLSEYYLSYLRAGQPASPNARKGLAYAHVLAPFDRSLSMTTAAMYVGQDQPEDAAQALRSVAYDPHGGGLSTIATTVLAALTSGGTKAAQAALAKDSKLADATAGSD